VPAVKSSHDPSTSLGMTENREAGLEGDFSDRACVYVQPGSPFDFAQGRLSTARPDVQTTHAENASGRSAQDDKAMGRGAGKGTIPTAVGTGGMTEKGVG
jgi:hypothetical protein